MMLCPRRRRPGKLERTGKASQGDCLVQPSNKPHAQWIKLCTVENPIASGLPHSERRDLGAKRCQYPRRRKRNSRACEDTAKRVDEREVRAADQERERTRHKKGDAV